MLKPIDRNVLSKQVFQQLKEEIIEKRYQPGERLPSEREMCEILKVNRSAVREALKRLEQARLIEIRQGGGSVVLDFRSNAGFDLLGDFIMQGGKANEVALRSIFEFRSLICPEIARLAALRIQDAELARLLPVVEQIESCPEDDPKKLQDLDFEFFAVIVHACENIAYMLIINSTKDIYFAYRDFFTVMHQEAMPKRGVYRQIYHALHAHDSEESARLLRELVEWHGRAFLERYRDQ